MNVDRLMCQPDKTTHEIVSFGRYRLRKGDWFSLLAEAGTENVTYASVEPKRSPVERVLALWLMRHTT